MRPPLHHLPLFTAACTALAIARAAPAQEQSLPDIVASTDRALVFLALRQHTDGAIGPPDLSPADRLQITSLTLLAFLASGHPPHDGRFGRVVARMTDYLAATDLPPPGPDSVALTADVVIALTQVLGVEPDSDRQQTILTSARRALARLTIGTSSPLPSDLTALDISALSRTIIALRAAQRAGVIPQDDTPSTATLQACLSRITEIATTPASAAPGTTTVPPTRPTALPQRPGEPPSETATAAVLLAHTLASPSIPPELYPALAALAQAYPTLTGRPRFHATLVFALTPPPPTTNTVPPAPPPPQEKDGPFAPQAVGPTQQLLLTAAEILTLTAKWQLLPAYTRGTPVPLGR